MLIETLIDRNEIKTVKPKGKGMRYFPVT